MRCTQNSRGISTDVREQRMRVSCETSRAIPETRSEAVTEWTKGVMNLDRRLTKRYSYNEVTSCSSSTQSMHQRSG